MTDAMLKAVLETAQATTEASGLSTLPAGRTLTLYVAHGGVSLTVTKLDSLETLGGVVRAKNAKNEVFLLALEDIFAAAVEGGGALAAGRKAGFSTEREPPKAL